MGGWGTNEGGDVFFSLRYLEAFIAEEARRGDIENEVRE